MFSTVSLFKWSSYKLLGNNIPSIATEIQSFFDILVADLQLPQCSRIFITLPETENQIVVFWILIIVIIVRVKKNWLVLFLTNRVSRKKSENTRVFNLYWLSPCKAVVTRIIFLIWKEFISCSISPAVFSSKKGWIVRWNIVVHLFHSNRLDSIFYHWGKISDI